MSNRIEASALPLVKHQPHNMPILKVLVVFLGLSLAIAFTYEFLL